MDARLLQELIKIPLACAGRSLAAGARGGTGGAEDAAAQAALCAQGTAVWPFLPQQDIEAWAAWVSGNAQAWISALHLQVLTANVYCLPLCMHLPPCQDQKALQTM